METRPGAASRLGHTLRQSQLECSRHPGSRWQRGPGWQPVVCNSSSGRSNKRTARSLRTGAATARPQRVQQQPPPLLQQLLPLLPPPLLQLLPQPPPRARASPAAEPPGAAAPPPSGRGYPPPGRARGRPARPQQPGARRAIAACPPPRPRRCLSAHFNAAGSRGARAPGGASLPVPSPSRRDSRPGVLLPDRPALCGGPVTATASGTS